MLESTVSKKTFRIFVEKTFEKAQYTPRLWNTRQSIDIEDWYIQNLKKKVTPSETRQKLKRDLFFTERSEMDFVKF